MKLTIIYIRQILITILLVLITQVELFSQGTDMSTSKQQSMFIGINLEPSQTQIINLENQAIPGMLSNKKSSISGSLEIGYMFSKNIGLSSGIGLSSFSAELTLDSYQSSFTDIDSENESYEKRVSGSGIKELQKISFLSVPALFNLKFPFGEKTGFFIQTGLRMNIPMNKSYTSSGTFTYKGFYPVYNVLIENLPAFGFPTNLDTNYEGKLPLKSMDLNVVANAGIDYHISNNIQIAIAAGYERSLSSISNSKSPDSFQLSTDPNLVYSLMEGSTKTTVSSIGLKISIRYYLK